MNIYKEHYNKKTDYGINQTRKNKILEIVGDVKGQKILDMGCATGYLGKLLIDKGAEEVIGIDISNEAIEKAKKVLHQAMQADIQTKAIPLNDKYFDIIIIAETLEHLLYPEKALAEAKRLLNDDGYIIVTTPNFLILPNRLRLLIGQFEYTEDGFLDRGHVHFFTYQSLLKFVKDNAFALTQENHTIHDRVPLIIGNKFPGLFAFQLIIKINKA